MNNLTIIVATFLAVTAALPYDFVEDSEGRQYYVIPIARKRREVRWNIKDPGVVSGSGISDLRYVNGNQKFVGTITVSNNLAQSHSPRLPGGRDDYYHISTGNGVGVGAPMNGIGDWARRYGGTGQPTP